MPKEGMLFISMTAVIYLPFWMTILWNSRVECLPVNTVYTTLQCKEFPYVQLILEVVQSVIVRSHQKFDWQQQKMVEICNSEFACYWKAKLLVRSRNCKYQHQTTELQRAQNFNHRVHCTCALEWLRHMTVKTSKCNQFFFTYFVFRIASKKYMKQITVWLYFTLHTWMSYKKLHSHQHICDLLPS